MGGRADGRRDEPNRRKDETAKTGEADGWADGWADGAADGADGKASRADGLQRPRIAIRKIRKTPD